MVPFPYHATLTVRSADSLLSTAVNKTTRNFLFLIQKEKKKKALAEFRIVALEVELLN